MHKILEKQDSYLKTEMSQSQEWVGKAINTQTAAADQATETIMREIFENFWFPRCKIRFDNIRNQS